MAEKTVKIPAAFEDMASHDKVLEYLQHRLQTGLADKQSRVGRYRGIDEMVANKAAKATPKDCNKAKAVDYSLPLVDSHIDDMVAFYAEVYSPTTGSFYQIPDDEDDKRALADKLVTKLNADAKASKYYKQLCRFLRSALKYNLGGFHVEYAQGHNMISSLDVYNFMWDVAVKDVAHVAKNAEWAAVVKRESAFTLMRRERDTNEAFVGVERLAEAQEAGTVYYDEPDSEAHDATQVGSNALAQRMYLALDEERAVDSQTHEVVTMYCWLKPEQFGLVGDAEGLQLWRFDIVDDSFIFFAQPVGGDEIPFYACFLNQDELCEHQKSVSERLGQFQNFISTMYNTYVDVMRNNIWGLTVYDPEMYDLQKLEAGTTSAYIQAKHSAKDLAAGIRNLSTKADTRDIMPAVAETMNLVRAFFPSQALPSQVAGMDRAVNSQVAAVMQGAHRRLHMQVQVLDSDVMQPMSMALYRNLATDTADLAGLTDEDARRILGTGIAQLGRAQSESAMRQLLFALIQNPDSIKELDVMRLMNFWATLLNVDIDLENFRRRVDGQESNPVRAQDIAG